MGEGHEKRQLPAVPTSFLSPAHVGERQGEGVPAASDSGNAGLKAAVGVKLDHPSRPLRDPLTLPSPPEGERNEQ